MKITVLHLNQDRDTGAVIGFDPVAEVNVRHTKDVDAALEYAYRYTNNVDGSWSMKIGSDANSDVTVFAPLPVYNGRTYGHRSTSMFDRMIVNGKTYRVAMFGFDEVVKE